MKSIEILSRSIKFFLVLLGMYVSTSAYSQEIAKYEISFPNNVYAKFLGLEESTIENSDTVFKIEQYVSLAHKVLEYNNNLSLYYGTRAYNLSDEIKNDSLNALSSQRLSVVHINLRNYDKSEIHIKKNIDYWTEKGDSMNLSQSYIYYGYLDRVRGKPYQGIENLYKARAIRLNFMPLAQLFDVSNRLVIAYMKIEDYENAVKIGEEFLDAYFKTGKRKNRARNILYGMYYSNLELERYDKANELAELVVPMYLSSKTPKTQFYGFSMAAEVAERNKKYNLAKSYADSALIVAKRTEINDLIGSAYFSQYSALKKMNKPEEAFNALITLRPYYLKSKRKSKILDVAEAYSYEMAARGRYQKAYEDLYLADSLRKDLFQEDLADQVRKLENKIIREENAKQVALLNDKNIAIESNLAQEKKLRYLLLGILGITGISAFLLWNFYNQRKKLNQLLLEKNKKLQSALEDNQFLVKEVHHRVKNNMQVIASLLNLQSRVITNDQAKEAIIASKSRILSMSLLHKNIYGNENLTAINLQVYFSDLLDSLENTYETETKPILINTNIEPIEIKLDMAVQLGLIANEIISNAYKHAFPNQESGKISIEVIKLGDHIRMVIGDNGKGLSEENITNKSNSLGIRLINSFTKKLKADLQIDKKEGTKFTINIPL